MWFSVTSCRISRWKLLRIHVCDVLGESWERKNSALSPQKDNTEMIWIESPQQQQQQPAFCRHVIIVCNTLLLLKTPTHTAVGHRLGHTFLDWDTKFFHLLDLDSQNTCRFFFEIVELVPLKICFLSNTSHSYISMRIEKVSFQSIMQMIKGIFYLLASFCY